MFRDREDAGRRLADEVVVLATPSPFYAVAQAYENRHDVPDEEAPRLFSAGVNGTG
jgi:predicted phosphoribosyltransferase